jgi:hypothetical protein
VLWPGVIASPDDFIVMLEQMVGCKYQFPDDLDLSGVVKDLIKRMLAPEPHKYV